VNLKFKFLTLSKFRSVLKTTVAIIQKDLQIRIAKDAEIVAVRLMSDHTDMVDDLAPNLYIEKNIERRFISRGIQNE